MIDKDNQLLISYQLFGIRLSKNDKVLRIKKLKYFGAYEVLKS